MTSKKKANKTKKEEQQAKKVIRIIFVALIVLGLVLMLGVSFMS